MGENLKVQIKTRLLPLLILGFLMLGFMACQDDKDADDKDADNKDSDKAKECTVTFNLGYTTSKTPPAPIRVKKGEAAGSEFPENPSRTIWDFTGWKDSSDPDVVYDSTTIINDDVTLKASWYFEPGPANPFITDRFTADPAAFIDYDGTVYIVCGHDELEPGNTDDFKITEWLIYSTKDMKTFKYENVLMKSEGFTYGQANSAWAAQAIMGLDERYYFYGTVQTAQGQAVSVAVADSPTGPWKQPSGKTTPLVTAAMASADTGGSTQNIDPTVFIDDDGTAWLSWSQGAPRIIKLKENMIEIDRDLTSTPQKKIRLLFPTDWKTEHTYIEGPFLYKRKGIYYMIYASMDFRKNAETISYAMAREDPNNPGLEGLIGKSGVWTDGVPITDCAPGLDGQGNSYTIHPAVLDFKGQTYLFYHNAALRVTQEDGTVWNGATGRRSLCVDYLYFNDDGTIQFVDVRNLDGLSAPPKDE